MADGTNIGWTQATWNVITGCEVYSAGCKFCYAMTLAGTRLKHHPSRAGLTVATKNGPVWNGEVRFNATWLEQPLQWRRPRLIFVIAHGDLFHKAVPVEWRDKVFAVMALADHHTFQVLTKRSDLLLEYLTDPEVWKRIQAAAVAILAERDKRGGVWSPPAWPLRNVWCGISAEDQPNADERLEHLRQTPAAIRWASFEPLLGQVVIQRHHAEMLDWAVVGGESDKQGRARRHDLSWDRTLLAQCRNWGIAYFEKQAGANAIDSDRGVLDRIEFKHPAGADPAEWESDLRVQEYPSLEASI